MKNCFNKIVILFFLMVPMVSAQLADNADIQSTKQDYLGLKPAVQPSSLIDLSKLKFSHSYSLGFYSGGGISGSTGLYTGTMFYEFSPALSMSFKLGIAHDPGILVGEHSSTGATFLPGIHLNYHPSPNFTISAGFDTYYGDGYYGYYPYGYNGYYRRR